MDISEINYVAGVLFVVCMAYDHTNIFRFVLGPYSRYIYPSSHLMREVVGFMIFMFLGLTAIANVLNSWDHRRYSSRHIMKKYRAADIADQGDSQDGSEVEDNHQFFAYPGSYQAQSNESTEPESLTDAETTDSNGTEKSDVLANASVEAVLGGGEDHPSIDLEGTRGVVIDDGASQTEHDAPEAQGVEGKPVVVSTQGDDDFRTVQDGAERFIDRFQEMIGSPITNAEVVTENSIVNEYATSAGENGETPGSVSDMSTPEIIADENEVSKDFLTTDQKPSQHLSESDVQDAKDGSQGTNGIISKTHAVQGHEPGDVTELNESEAQGSHFEQPGEQKDVSNLKDDDGIYKQEEASKSKKPMSGSTIDSAYHSGLVKAAEDLGPMTSLHGFSMITELPPEKSKPSVPLIGPKISQKSDSRLSSFANQEKRVSIHIPSASGKSKSTSTYVLSSKPNSPKSHMLKISPPIREKSSGMSGKTKSSQSLPKDLPTVNNIDHFGTEYESPLRGPSLIQTDHAFPVKASSLTGQKVTKVGVPNAEDDLKVLVASVRTTKSGRPKEPMHSKASNSKPQQRCFPWKQPHLSSPPLRASPTTKWTLRPAIDENPMTPPRAPMTTSRVSTEEASEAPGIKHISESPVQIPRNNQNEDKSFDELDHSEKSLIRLKAQKNKPKRNIKLRSKPGGAAKLFRTIQKKNTKQKD